MADSRSNRLDLNVAALRRWAPDIADFIATAPDDPEIRGQRARDGTASIVAVHNGAQPLQIHSRYRPVDEARRIVTAIPAVATLIVHGMGAAFIPREFLSQHRAGSVIVTERSYATVRTILKEIDLAAECGSGRLRVATTPEELIAAIESVHLPMIRDGVQSVELTPWVSRGANRDHFAALHETIPATLRGIAEEIATMRHFGRPWLAHTVENTFRISWNIVPRRIDEFRRKTDRLSARVLAAGPGLDAWFAAPPPADDKMPEVTVDTALPAVATHGRQVLAVVSLDPQGWSPLHFRRVPLPAAYLCGDIGISPRVTATGNSFIPVASNHPLHQLLRNHGFPMLPATTSTNVTEAAVTVLRSVGSRDVEVIGADFGYPHAKTYARGTYHYGLAFQQARRLSPQESFFAGQVYPRTEMDASASFPLFRRAGMDSAERSLRYVLTSAPGVSQPTSPACNANGSSTPIQFWHTHLEELSAVLARIEHSAPRSTPEIVEQLGAHGRSHLPILPALDRVANRRDQSIIEPITRISSGLTDVRAFIFSHLCRYSK